MGKTEKGNSKTRVEKKIEFRLDRRKTEKQTENRVERIEKICTNVSAKEFNFQHFQQ